MLNRKIMAVVGAALLALGVAQPAFAQDGGRSDESSRASGSVSGESVLPGRIGGGRDQRRSRADRENGRAAAREQAAKPAATPEEIKAAAQAQLTAANVTCELTEAANPGMIGEAAVYEAACANTEGYILIASTPPQAFGCIELAGTAAITRSRDPAADVGQQCVLPANQNTLAVISGWARTAGATCTVDEAQAIGKSDDNNMVYEVGCANDNGYWLEKLADRWDLKDCIQVTSMGGACRFTTAEEQNNSFKAKLAGTDAAGCDVAQVRLMGSNANGSFYEAKCAAEGQGYIARLNNEGVTQQVYPCATAQSIGGGCTLTTAAPAAGGRP